MDRSQVDDVSSEASLIEDDLEADIQMLGEINLNHENLICFSDFCRISNVINKHVKPRLRRALTPLLKARRAALDNGNMSLYRDIIFEMK